MTAAPRDPAALPRLGWTLAALVLLWPLLRLADFRPAALFEPGNLAAMGHFLLEIQPPARPDAGNTTAKELVFLVDQSGSMNGEPIALVKRAMRRCLETMEPRDRFQIVGFSNSTVLFAPDAVPATRAGVMAWRYTLR